MVDFAASAIVYRDPRLDRPISRPTSGSATGSGRPSTTRFKRAWDRDSLSDSGRDSPASARRASRLDATTRGRGASPRRDLRVARRRGDRAQLARAPKAGDLCGGRGDRPAGRGGRVDVRDRPRRGRRRRSSPTSRKWRGWARAAFFGEMSLLTGAPRNATVRATVDSDLLEITADTFRAFVLANPTAVELVGLAASQRAAELEAVRASGPAATAPEPPARFLDRVRRFLRLASA